MTVVRCGGVPPADGQVAEFLQGIYHVNRQHLPWEVWVPCLKVATAMFGLRKRTKERVVLLVFNMH